ncbi:MAG: hypothetical protein AB1448_11195 [Pseudomonadota bacterium]
MSAIDLVPAGWLSAPDLLARFCDILHDVSDRPLDGKTATTVAALCIADAMAALRPGIGAFVQKDGRMFMLPGHVWRALANPDAPDDLLLSFITGRCRGQGFGSYQGLQLLFPYSETMIWLEGPARAAQSRKGIAYRDPERPWLDHTSPSAWLSSRRSTEFIDARLTAEGVTAPRPIDRDRALHAYLEKHGVAIAFSAVQGRRRPSRMTD